MILISDMGKKSVKQHGKTSGSFQLPALSYGLLFLMAFMAYCLWLTLRPIPSDDIWWTLKTGQLILEQRTIFHQDIFSFTAAGHEWINHEWLVCVLFYLIYSAGGFTALLILKSSVILAAYLIIFKTISAKSDVKLFPLSAAGILALLALPGHIYFDVRAFIFTYLFIALAILILEKGREAGSEKHLLWLVPLNILWVNMHGGFPVSIFLQLAYIFGKEANLWRACKRGTIKKKHKAGSSLGQPAWKGVVADLRIPLSVLGVSLLALLLNPYGYRMLTYPFEEVSFFHQDYYSRHITEWRAPEFLGANWHFSLVFGIFALSILFARKKIPLRHLFVFGGFSLLAFTSVRHIAIFSLAAIPAASIAFSRLGEVERRVERDSRLSKLKPWITAMLLVLLLTLAYKGFYHLPYRSLNMLPQMFPVGGAGFLEKNKLKGNLFNAYEWGGYLIWRLYPEYRVMIDGRANTVYPEKIYKDHIEIAWGIPGKWEALLDKYNIEIIIANKAYRELRKQRLIDMIENDPKWTLVYQENVDVVLVKTEGLNSDIISKVRDNTIELPETPSHLNSLGLKEMQNGHLQEALNMFKRAEEIDPYYVPALINFAMVSTNLGDYATAQDLLERVLSVEPENQIALYNLGNVYRQKGDEGRAEGYYRNVLELNPDFLPAKERLKELKK